MSIMSIKKILKYITKLVIVVATRFEKISVIPFYWEEGSIKKSKVIFKKL